ncbi:MAG: hypothetical protein JKY61_04550 [Planctomycetes bacterium]|nr:hypothetical protein [Planctomycetota bacterium]
MSTLHAATHIPANDRALREHLCRDPHRNDPQDRSDAATGDRALPLAQGSISLADDGSVLWELRSP